MIRKPKQWCGRRNRRLKEPLFKRVRKRFWSTFKIGAIILALPVFLLAVWAAYGELTTTKLLSIKNVDVVGIKRISKADVAALAGVSEGQNLFSFKSGNAEEGLRKNPWIKYVKVSRQLPDTVRIELKERTPAALVKLETMYVMDEDGVIFKEYANADGLDLPVVTGLTSAMLRDDEDSLEKPLLDLIHVLGARTGFNAKAISEIHADPAYGFSLYTLIDGVRVDIGMDAFEEKLAAFESIVASRGGRLGGVEAVRMTGAHEGIVRFGSNVI